MLTGNVPAVTIMCISTPIHAAKYAVMLRNHYLEAKSLFEIFSDWRREASNGTSGRIMALSVLIDGTSVHFIARLVEPGSGGKSIPFQAN